MTNIPDPSSNDLSASNYCVCFIDILGQRNALKDQGLLPYTEDKRDRDIFVREVLVKTVLPIIHLQKQANTFIEQYSKPEESTIRNMLPEEFRGEWDKIQGHELSVQYWSDGMVAFTCLGNRRAHTQINSAYALLHMAGNMCFINLSNDIRNPIRGGIDIAWGTELRKGELYGAAIARSYEIESEIAKYPRIVVGDLMVQFLNESAAIDDDSLYYRYTSSIANMCLQMITKDTDGQFIVHYLGEFFQENISKDIHHDMYNEAVLFVREELGRFKEIGDRKLEERYEQLLSYFLANPPIGT